MIGKFIEAVVIEEIKSKLSELGNGSRLYTNAQKDYIIKKAQEIGVRATSRLSGLPRRTIQRWLRNKNIKVKRCPDWVYEWVERRRKRKEFWKLRGY